MAERLRCESGEWKTRNQFSKSSLAKYDQAVFSGTASSSKTGIRCLEHANKQDLEYRCKGPCGRRRELGRFSKSSRRSGKYWCVDCTDWQIKTENGETLPPPGSQLSAEELGTRIPHPAHLRDDMIFQHNSHNESDDTESTVATDDGASVVTSSMSGLSLSDQQSAASESLVNEATTTDGSEHNELAPPHLQRPRSTRAPHWLIPDFDGPRPWTLGSHTTSATGTSVSGTSVSGTSVVGSDMTVSAGRPRGQPVSFNAWGPNGEYQRMVKTPTVVTSSTRDEPLPPRQPLPENRGRGGWAKVPSRKQPPQLPDYLKYDIPTVDDDDDDDEDSDDDF